MSQLNPEHVVVFNTFCFRLFATYLYARKISTVLLHKFIFIFEQNNLCYLFLIKQLEH